MGRIGGLAVALGIGVALVSGWSGGLAWADDSPGSAGTAASSDSTRSAGTTASGDSTARRHPRSTGPSARPTRPPRHPPPPASMPLTRRMSRSRRRSRRIRATRPQHRPRTPTRTRRSAIHAETVRSQDRRTPEEEDPHSARRCCGRPRRRAGRAGDRRRLSARRRCCRSYGAVGRQRVAADGDDSVTDGHRAAGSQTSSVTYGWPREPGGYGRRQRDLEAAGRHELAGIPSRRAVVVGDAGLRAARVRVHSAIAVRDGRTRHDE